MGTFEVEYIGKILIGCARLISMSLLISRDKGVDANLSMAQASAIVETLEKHLKRIGLND